VFIILRAEWAPKPPLCDTQADIELAVSSGIDAAKGYTAAARRVRKTARFSLPHNHGWAKLSGTTRDRGDIGSNEPIHEQTALRA
jgi:hypothetical protein